MVNFLRGSVRLTATGPFPERFLNLCAQNGIRFWNVEQPEGGTVGLTVVRRDRKRALALGEKALCTVTMTNPRGVPAFLARFHRRYALLLGLALSLTAVCVLSQFILTVEVSGNETVPTAEILTQLRRLGLRPGTYGPGIDEAMLGQNLLLRVDDLSWCAVNLKGTVAQVLVREAVKKPPLLDEKLLGDVVASAPGIITHMDVLEGEPAVGEGSTVLPGEVLIAGSIHMEAPEYSTTDLGWRQVRAQGKVYARTWHTLEAALPATAPVKVYTGASATRWTVELPRRNINFFGNSGISFARYDKIEDTWNLKLPGGLSLPMALRRETVREYVTQPAPVDRAAAEAMLKERLGAALTARIGPEGKPLHLTYTARRTESAITVRLEAECSQEIGRFRQTP